MIITIDGNIPSTFAHSINVMKMAQGFVDIGEDVTLVTLLSWPNLWKLLKIRDIYHFYGVSPKVKIKWVPVYNRDFWTKNIHAKDFNQKAAQMIFSLKPNYVYCRSFLTAFLCVKKAIPVILETHTTHYDNVDLQKIYTIAHNNNFLGLVTIHDDIRDQHIQHGIPADKIRVLPDGVDLKEFEINSDQGSCRAKLNLPLDKKIVLYCGSLHPEKGISSIIECAQSLAGRVDIQFFVVGGTDQDVSFWKQQAEMKKTNINFVGFVPHTDVPFYLKAADVLLMPYSKKVDYQVMDVHTTSPLKLYEYMASGRPIVSTNIASVANVLPHEQGALLAEPDATAELVNHIEKLLMDQDLVRRLTKYAKEKVIHYQWQNRCLQIRNSFLSSVYV